MRFVDEYRSNEKVQTLLEAIRKKGDTTLVYHGDLWRANTCYRPLSAGRDVAAGSSTAPWAGLPGLCNTGRDNRLRLEVGDTAECDLSLFRGYDASSGK